MNQFVRQAAAMTGRYLRQLSRQPAYIFITLTQPMIWLLLFGSLFKGLMPSYFDYLTPGVVMMTALFSAGWSGMGAIEDIDAGVMDRFLVAPISRSAMVAGTLVFQAVSTLIQSVVIIGIGYAVGARFAGGVAGAAVLVGAAVLLAIAVAALSNSLAMVTRNRETLIAAASGIVLPLTFLSTVFLQQDRITAWIRDIARFNPVDWATKAGRLAVGADVPWGTVGSYALFLAVAVALTGTLATRAFRAYQRSV